MVSSALVWISKLKVSVMVGFAVVYFCFVGWVVVSVVVWVFVFSSFPGCQECKNYSFPVTFKKSSASLLFCLTTYG